MKIVHLLVGIPASGKSTWAKKFISENPDKKIGYVSRDEIRFKKLENGDKTDYFAYEKEVFKEFISAANNSIETNDITIIDATHINAASRTKTLSRLHLEGVVLYVDVFEISAVLAIARNEGREGLAKVPPPVIESMAANFRLPTAEEINAFDGWVIAHIVKHKEG